MTDTPDEVYLAAALASMNARGWMYATAERQLAAQRDIAGREPFRASIDVAFAAGRAAEVEERNQEAMSRD
jgi:hypothetical protein